MCPAALGATLASLQSSQGMQGHVEGGLVEDAVSPTGDCFDRLEVMAVLSVYPRSPACGEASCWQTAWTPQLTVGAALQILLMPVISRSPEIVESNTEGNVTNTSKIDGIELEVNQFRWWEDLSLVVPLSSSSVQPVSSAGVFRQNQLLTEVVTLKRLEKLFFLS